MPQDNFEIAGFIFAFFIILSSFIIGVLLYLRQYQKRKHEHEEEKKIINEQHQLQLLQTQLTSQQQTMQHIGREIHDSVGQKLTLASIYSNQIAETDAKKESIKKLIDESLQELRQLSKSLTDPAFTELSIIHLLQKEAARINTSEACFVMVETNSTTIELQPAAKNILFRLLQEFIQNSLKHAQCRTIKIVLNINPDELQVTARDDGKGFDKNKIAPGSGLYNMNRRAEELDAQLNIESEPGKGTQLHLTIPLNK